MLLATWVVHERSLCLSRSRLSQRQTGGGLEAFSGGFRADREASVGTAKERQTEEKRRGRWKERLSDRLG